VVFKSNRKAVRREINTKSFLTKPKNRRRKRKSQKEKYKSIKMSYQIKKSTLRIFIYTACLGRLSTMGLSKTKP